MCGIVFVAGWHADTARHCSCAQDDVSMELMGRLRDANAVRGQSTLPTLPTFHTKNINENVQVQTCNTDTRRH